MVESLVSASEPIGFDQLPYSKKIKERVKKNEVLVFSELTSYDQMLNPELMKTLKPKHQKKFQGKKTTLFQKMKFSMVGLHTRKCRFALRKLSQYEDYSKYLNAVKESFYHEAKQEVNFLIAPSILPIQVRFFLKIPRIRKPGIYPFVFDRGFFKNLKGEFHVTELNKQCLVYIKGDWAGPHTGYSDFLLELFSKTTSKLCMEHMFRISSSY